VIPEYEPLEVSAARTNPPAPLRAPSKHQAIARRLNIFFRMNMTLIWESKTIIVPKLLLNRTNALSIFTSQE
jgi:hypothetical protein